jgi:hypothetical protein
MAHLGTMKAAFFQAISVRKSIKIEVLSRQTRTSHPLPPDH